MDAWVAGFGLLHTDAQVQYSPDGSGAGRTAFLAGAVDFAGSDAYLDDQELERSRKICGPDGAFDVPDTFHRSPWRSTSRASPS